MKNIVSKKLLAVISLLLLGAILTVSCTDRDGCPGKITRSNPPVQHSV